jgi:hypothetical protein
MNCGRFWPVIVRSVIAAVITVLIFLAIPEKMSWFQAAVIYMLNQIGLSIWDIGKELTSRMKALDAFLDGDREMDDDIVD